MKTKQCSSSLDSFWNKLTNREGKIVSEKKKNIQTVKVHITRVEQESRSKKFLFSEKQKSPPTQTESISIIIYNESIGNSLRNKTSKKKRKKVSSKGTPSNII